MIARRTESRGARPHSHTRRSLTDLRECVIHGFKQKLKKIEASQRAIAKVIGVSQPTIHKDLEGDRNLSPAQEKPNETKGSEPPGDRNLSPAPTPLGNVNGFPVGKDPNPTSTATTPALSMTG